MTTRRPALLLVACLLLAACTEAPDSAAAGDGGDDDGSEEGGGEVESIGLMVQDLSNPFFLSMQEAVEAAGEEIGASVATEDGRQDLGAQNEQIDAFIQQQIDVLLLNAVDSEGIGPAVERAVDAGITVVAVDVAAAGALATVTSDNTQAGEQACEYLMEEIGGEGGIFIIDGTPITSVQDRVAGCESVLEDYPDVEVLATQAGDNGRSLALDITTDLLTSNPDVDGIFGINDPTALGATLAAQQAGLTDVVIVGVDGSPEATAEMEDEDTLFRGTPAQDPGGLAVTGLEIATGIRAGEEPEEDLVLVPTELITHDNLADYEGWQ